MTEFVELYSVKTYLTSKCENFLQLVLQFVNIAYFAFFPYTQFFLIKRQKISWIYLLSLVERRGYVSLHSLTVSSLKTVL